MLIHELLEATRPSTYNAFKNELKDKMKVVQSYGPLTLTKTGMDYHIWDGDKLHSSANEMSNDYAKSEIENQLLILAKKKSIKAPAPKPWDFNKHVATGLAGEE